MNSESVDLIYLDPPFNSNANYAAPIGSAAAGAEFKDTWTLRDIDISWLELLDAKYKELSAFLGAVGSKSDKSYLIYMSPRLIEMHRVLKHTGSIYLHCDPTMNHYLKIAMDCIFGRSNFRNEVIWTYPPGGNPPKNNFPRKHDTILFYSKTNEVYFEQPYSELTEKAIKKFSFIDEKGRRYKQYRKNGRAYRTYLENAKGRPLPSWWTDIVSLGQAVTAKERTGYPTQKPLALLQRIIKASCPKNGVVLDPFCGCATTCVAAEGESRDWLGIDISPMAATLVKRRIERDLPDEFEVKRLPIHLTQNPQRTDIEKLPPYNCEDNKIVLFGRQDGKCNAKGCDFQALERRHLTIDHIIPRTKGGSDHLENLQMLCGSCNSAKGNRTQEYLEAWLGR